MITDLITDVLCCVRGQWQFNKSMMTCHRDVVIVGRGTPGSVLAQPANEIVAHVWPQVSHWVPGTSGDIRGGGFRHVQHEDMGRDGKIWEEMGRDGKMILSMPNSWGTQTVVLDHLYWDTGDF